MLRKHKSKTANGFTMIELLVVIAMVGIIGAIAAPSWQGFLDRQRMNSARSDLMSTLKTAQDRAQSRQQSQEVTFTSPLSVTIRNASSSTPGIATRLSEGEVGDKFNLVASTPVVFDNDGRVDVATPYVIKIVNTSAPANASGSRPQSCVVIMTLLGSLRPASGDLCDTF